MHDEQYFRYYKLTGTAVSDIDAQFAPIPARRTEILSELLKATGAVAVIEKDGWGENGSLVSAVVFAASHPFPVPVKILRKDQFEGQSVVQVSGKGNTKEGKAFNAEMRQHLDTANSKLKDAPVYADFLIKHFNIRCCSIGGPVAGRPFGSKMISTRCGHIKGDKNTLVFAIPNASGNDKQPEVPAEFVEITYGQFYDLTN